MFISSFFVCFFGKSEICWSLICFAYSFSITYYILSSKIININQKKRTISTKHSGPIFCFEKFLKFFREFFRCLVRTAFLIVNFFSFHIPWPNFFTQCITKMSIISKRLICYFKKSSMLSEGQRCMCHASSFGSVGNASIHW